jgi:DNA topoisomerase-3
MLILCEKPSVARDFASALGAVPKKGFFEGNGYIVTYCVGHLFELWNPEDYDPKYKKWSLETLPIIPEVFKYGMNSGTSEQAKLVLGLLKKHDGDDVLVATDAGREGELIARIAIQEAGIADTCRFRRFWVSEALTPDVICNGIRDARPLSEYDTLSRQAFARQRADWLVGINLSRLMSVGNPPPPWSVGRVQTAVLSAIGARNGEVKNFVAVPYKELEACVTPDSQIDGIYARLENPKTGKSAFFPEDEGYLLAAKKDCEEKAVDSVDVESSERRKKPEKLLNITGLQKKAYKLFGYNPEETLALAQALYETHKCLSYPRTPSRVMGDNNVGLFLDKFELLKDASIDGSVLSTFCNLSLINASNKHIFNSAQLEDHHALIPLNRLPESANEKERNVYNIVLYSFFAVCMPDYIYDEKSLRFHVGAYIFAAKIRETVHDGWTEALGPEEDDDEQHLDLGSFDFDNCFLFYLHIQEKKTQPKKEFAMDTLLAFMEHPRGEGETGLVGLGTPATRAEIIRKLFAADYVREDRKRLYATERGRFLLEQLSRNELLNSLADVSNTTDWEERLSKNPGAFEREMAEFVAECVKVGPGRAVFQKPSLGACPLCGRPVHESKLSYCCSGYREDPICTFTIWKTIAGATLSQNDAQLLLNGRKTKPKKCRGKKGPFEAAFALKGGEIVFVFGK